MKATLTCKPHTSLRNTNVYEVHYDGQLICTVTGADGPGVRVISKYPVKIQEDKAQPPIPGMTQLLFEVPKPRGCDHKFIDSKCCVKCGWSPE